MRHHFICGSLVWSTEAADCDGMLPMHLQVRSTKKENMQQLCHGQLDKCLLAVACAVGWNNNARGF
jgi:hypothetical protein